jgi:hypothetical protein
VFQTRIKLGDSVPIQWVPIKAVGARPAGMKDVKLSPEDATARPEKKSFLQQYVRAILIGHHAEFLLFDGCLLYMQWYIVLFMVIYMFLGRTEPAKAGGAASAEAPAPAAK